MRILWVSDSPFSSSSYALQSKLFVPRIVDAGHEVIWFATLYQGAEQRAFGARIVGGGGDVFGNTQLAGYVQRFKPDVVITFKDLYVYHPPVLDAASKLAPIWPLVPVDTEPLAMPTQHNLRYCAHPIAICASAFRHLHSLHQDAGFNAPVYAPLGVDMDFWTPGDKHEARQKLNIPNEVFMAAFVGANQGTPHNPNMPNRKGLDKLILAWQLFTRQHEDALLYLHTMATSERHGLELQQMINMHQLQNSVRLIDPLDMTLGIDQTQLRDVYRAADVLVQPSMGEGFGLPVVEAQSCGTPVITQLFAAYHDTARTGWNLRDDKRQHVQWLENMKAYRAAPQPLFIAQALERAYEHRDDEALAIRARYKIADYHIDTVFDEHWLPLLQRMEQKHGRTA